ncbi:MAG: hypothetical protein QXH96_01880 [Candidatus Geothermarchaeota archaeon]
MSGKVYKEIKSRGVMLIDDVLNLYESHGDSLINALDIFGIDGCALELKFGNHYIARLFIGRRDNYIVMPDVKYCSCISKQFFMKRDIECYHIVGYKLLKSLNKVRRIKLKERELLKVMRLLREK